MKEFVLHNGKYLHMVSDDDLYVDGVCVCHKPAMFIRYLFEKFIIENNYVKKNNPERSSTINKWFKKN